MLPPSRRTHALRLLIALGMALLGSPAFGQGVFTGYESGHVLTHHTFGYDYFRIPTLVQAQDGTLLAFSEGRKEGTGDIGDIDLLLSRSFDGGLTWQSPEVIGDHGFDVWGNPAPVVDQLTGTIHVLSTIEQNSRIMIQSSTDNGATWSTAREITDTAAPQEFYRVGTGPVHGIQLERGANAGRLVVPCWVQSPTAVPSEFATYTLYSDDGGQNWQMGEGISSYANESTVAELTNGDVYLNTRNYDGSYQRASATSSDGGETFGEKTIDWGLPDPRVQASILRYEALDAGDDSNRLLFSNPDSPANIRRNMTVRSSFDETQTWTEGKMIHRGPSAYSDMVKLQDGTIGLLYESGYGSAYHHITFARFTEEWLDDPTIFQLDFEEGEPGAVATDGMTLKDSRGYDEHGKARWGPVFGDPDERFEQTAALSFNRGADCVEINNEYTDHYLAFTAQDSFTFEANIRTSAHDGAIDPLAGTLLAKGDDTTGGFRWFLQDGRSQFEYWDDAGNSHLVMGDAVVTDGEWHHLAMARNTIDGKFEFFIDYQLDTWMWASTDLVPEMGLNDTSLLIGCDIDSYGISGDGQYVGRMDFIRASHGVLDPSAMVGGPSGPGGPFAGDINQDGLFDGDDVTALYGFLGGTDMTWDFNGDLVIDFGDVQVLLDEYGHTIFGDLNVDGQINGTDFSSLAVHFADAGGYAEGDLNADGFIDGLDLSSFSGMFLANYPAGVPEPSSVALLIAAAGWCLRRRRSAKA